MCTDCRNTVTEDSLAAEAAAMKMKSYEDAPVVRRGSFDDEPTLNVAAPMREIPEALLIQDRANDRLAKAVEILHDRTINIRHSGIERGEEDRTMRDFGSETARNIADQANRTDMAARVIEKILTEMEI